MPRSVLPVLSLLLAIANGQTFCLRPTKNAGQWPYHPSEAFEARHGCEDYGCYFGWFHDEFDLWPTVRGTSVGRWEGDTLVIETIMVRSPIEYFHGAPPFSEEAHYEERIRLEGDRLVSDVTVTDPVTLTEPFVTQVSWVRDEGFDRMIEIDWDNDRTGVDENGVNTIEMEVVE